MDIRGVGRGCYSGVSVTPKRIPGRCIFVYAPFVKGCGMGIV